MGGGDILRQGYIMCKGPGVVGLCREAEELTRALGASEYEQEYWSIIFPAEF